MTRLNITRLSVYGTPEAFLEKSVKRIEKIIPPEKFLFTEKEPDVLFFLTGGTELTAMKLAEAGHFYLLIGSQHHNSYASATEVKAFLNEKGIPSLLLDEEEESTPVILSHFLTVKNAVKQLKGKKLGLIGMVSEWLISSEIPAELLSKKLGIQLSIIPWNELKHFSEFEPSDVFLTSFSSVKNTDLNDSARVHEFLSQIINDRKLDAITVECFPMVKNDKVTACLPLAKFNNEGIPAGCEGDLTAIAGMMLCKELTGIIPWMANINKATHDMCLFSHCTIAPGLVSAFSIKTHFETGEGSAIEGNFKNNKVTIFRFDRHLSKAFIASSNITARPKSESACRTQIEVKLTENEVNLLKQYPLGNHHLIIPGDFKQLLQFACEYLGIAVLK